MRESPPMAHREDRPHHPGRGTGRRAGFALLTVPTVVLLTVLPAGASSGGRQIKDTENTRTVYLVCAALVLLAVGLAVFTWWFWRNTRRDPEALAPLEVMGERRFVDGDQTTRQTLLDANRPVGAVPLVLGAVEPLMIEPEAEPVPASAASDGDATEAGGIDPELGEQTKLLEIPAVPVAPVVANGSEQPTPVANGAGPIDPGLPPTPDESDGKQLSLAELANLDPGFQEPFDPDALTSTPSTGIPIVESPEAWLERELGRGRHNGDAAPAPTGDRNGDGDGDGDGDGTLPVVVATDADTDELPVATTEQESGEGRSAEPSAAVADPE